MDLGALMRTLPKELLYMVTNYDPPAIFLVHGGNLEGHDWMYLAKANFGLDYPRGRCTNQEMMSLYWEMCDEGNQDLACGKDHTMVLSADEKGKGKGKGKLMSCGDYQA